MMLQKYQKSGSVGNACPFDPDEMFAVNKMSQANRSLDYRTDVLYNKK